MTKPAIAVQALGQSIWLDNISRDSLMSGEFAAMVGSAGVTGVTSNPTIFDKAISSGDSYDAQMVEIARTTSDPSVIFDALALRDLQQAADLLRPVFDRTGGADGFVSWEVSPEIAHDTERTLADVRRLWQLLDRPNAMIKIPGTRAGLPAIQQALYEGININITLLFAIERYETVMEQYLTALERRAAAGLPLDRVRSVASFFVSRVDTAVDKQLTALAARDEDGQRSALLALRGQAAIANAKLAYQRFKAVFSGPRWQALAGRGAPVQRPLWASTSTKDPSLPDTFYVDTLIGPDTVNTLPPATLAAFNDHGRVAATLEDDVEGARRVMSRLAEAGIDMTAVTDRLEDEGVASFAASFAALRNSIEQKRARLLASVGGA